MHLVRKKTRFRDAAKEAVREIVETGKTLFKLMNKMNGIITQTYFLVPFIFRQKINFRFSHVFLS